MLIYFFYFIHFNMIVGAGRFQAKCERKNF